MKIDGCTVLPFELNCNYHKKRKRKNINDFFKDIKNKLSPYGLVKSDKENCIHEWKIGAFRSMCLKCMKIEDNFLWCKECSRCCDYYICYFDESGICYCCRNK